MDNPRLELARRYVEQTGVSMFLTGKAGTGKTTFLRDMDAHVGKRHVVLAPTGVAAVNAGGVTIHSFFQLPFEPYLPEVKELVTEYQMPDKHKSLSKNKINIIRTLELLIIDEISMVRADLLDAVDAALRRYRRSRMPFGGVQLLMIGDVHQLSPVVTEKERPYMEQVYPSPFFFHSKALQQLNYVTIELDTVYRQQDARFVELLNRVRDNRIDARTIEILNRQVRPPSNEAITLTTHNRQAQAINSRHMEALTGPCRVFKAEVTGNFSEGAMPVDRELELKVGERVMFVKNDSSGQHRYYNGKLATVTDFVQADGQDRVETIDDEGDVVFVGREQWEAVKYSLDHDNKIVQEVEGTFSQFPLKAAWAVTIHKAQGLTFDRVNIDAADAFAYGQVYVALSRCRSLEGLVLTSPLRPEVVFSDADVSRFIASQPTYEQVDEAASLYERQYHMEQLCSLFDMDAVVHDASRLMESYMRLRSLYPDKVDQVRRMADQLVELGGVGERFRHQLMSIDAGRIEERTAKGAEYFAAQLGPMAVLLPELLDVEIDNKENRKLVKESGERLSESLGMKVACLSAVCRDGFSVSTLQKARTDYLLADDKAPSRKGKRHGDAAKATKESATDDMHTPLVELIRQWRSSKAEEEHLPPYVVLQQKALLAIASNLPTTPAELKRQLGVGPKTVERYGRELLDIVNNYMEYYGITKKR